MKLEPLFDRIVVKHKKQQVSSGGIILPNGMQEKIIEAEVVAVGEGKYLENGTTRKPRVKVGDTVILGIFSGMKVETDIGEYVVVREDDVGVIVRDD